MNRASTQGRSIAGRASSSTRQEGGQPSSGAAGCRWSDIKYYSASHLVAALVGQKNSLWASSGLWTGCSGLTRPSSDPQTGLCSANQQGPPLRWSVAGSAPRSESASQSRGEKSRVWQQIYQGSCPGST